MLLRKSFSLLLGVFSVMLVLLALPGCNESQLEKANKAIIVADAGYRTCFAIIHDIHNDPATPAEVRTELAAKGLPALQSAKLALDAADAALRIYKTAPDKATGELLIANLSVLPTVVNDVVDLANLALSRTGKSYTIPKIPSRQ